jgi:hypothetical protein
MKKRGRPTKYKIEYVEQAEKLCKLGTIDREIADFFNVEESTLNNWKNDYPDFLESIKRGKDFYDCQTIESSLRRRANGYEHKETKVFCQDGQIITHEMVKRYPPDTTAAIFFLKNRHPDRWNDKIEIEHSGDITLEI